MCQGFTARSLVIKLGKNSAVILIWFMGKLGQEHSKINPNELKLECKFYKTIERIRWFQYKVVG